MPAGSERTTPSPASPPGAVAQLVYLAAFLPADGDSVLALSADDPGSAVTASSLPVAGGQAVGLRPECLRALFYADCEDCDVAVATRLLVPEPLAPFAGRVRVTPERAGRSRRTGRKC